MGKEKFNWKGLFVNEDETTKEEENFVTEESKPVTASTTFPGSSSPVSKFPDSPPKGANISNATLNTIIEMYESGFDSLNQPGYDFYEFFKAVKAVGSNDPTVYKMAYTMAKGVDTKVTKDSLLQQGEFYVNEIEKVHKQYKGQGSTKKNQLLDTQRTLKESLIEEVASLEKKLIEIQNQINDKKEQLTSLDVSLMKDVSEIDQKIVANDMARSKILETIMTVINGIKTNI